MTTTRARLRELHAKATKGAWEEDALIGTGGREQYRDSQIIADSPLSGGKTIVVCDTLNAWHCFDEDDRQNNMTFIVEAHNALPSLLDELDAADAEIARLREILSRALALKGGWREAITELEDHCSEPVRLKNMIAAADQLDEWATTARAALAPKEPK